MPVTVAVGYPNGRPKGFPLDLTINVKKPSKITNQLAVDAMLKAIAKLGATPPTMVKFRYYVPSDK